MNIYVLPVPKFLQPDTQGFIWPPGCDDYGVEQNFLSWLQRSGLQTKDHRSADWHYLPVFWNRWYLTADNRSGRGAFTDAIQAAMLERECTFTICEYDPLGLQPDVDLSGVTVFTANRMADNGTIDIPLLLNPHQLGWQPPKRRLACFVGHLDTHPIRREMEAALAGRPDCYVTNEPHDIDRFVEILRSSHVALAPRGDGAQSFRFYEAMQAGTVPLYLSDLDARPFQKWLDWDAMSLYLAKVEGLSHYLSSLHPKDLAWMSQNAQEAWHNSLRYGAWCPYVIKELEGR